VGGIFLPKFDPNLNLIKEAADRDRKLTGLLWQNSGKVAAFQTVRRNSGHISAMKV
jgi:hypothetical protein